MYDLVQRVILKNESGINPSPMRPLEVGDIRFDGAFYLDYMGDSELEDRRLLGESLRLMQREGLVLTKTEACFGDVRRDIWFLAPPGFEAVCSDDWWRALYDDDYIDALFHLWPGRLAAPSGLFDRAAHDTAWWSLGDRAAWTFNQHVGLQLRHAFGQVDLVRR